MYVNESTVYEYEGREPFKFKVRVEEFSTYWRKIEKYSLFGNSLLCSLDLDKCLWFHTTLFVMLSALFLLYSFMISCIAPRSLGVECCRNNWRIFDLFTFFNSSLNNLWRYWAYVSWIMICWLLNNLFVSQATRIYSSSSMCRNCAMFACRQWTCCIGIKMIVTLL